MTNSLIPPRARETLRNNRNYSLQNRFLLELDMFPGVGFTCQSVNGIGGITMPVTEFDSKFKKIPLAGSGGLIYDDLSIVFIVSEDLRNYYSIHKWIMINGHSGQWGIKKESEYGLGSEEAIPTSSIFYKGERENISGLDELSDGRVYILDSDNRKTFRVDLYSIIPYRLGSLIFSTKSTGADIITSSCMIKYQKIQFMTFIDPNDPTQRLEQAYRIDENVENVEDMSTHYRPATTTEELYKNSNTFSINEAMKRVSR